MSKYHPIRQPPGWLIIRLLNSLICLIFFLNQVISFESTSSHSLATNSSSNSSSIVRSKQIEKFTNDKNRQDPSLIIDNTSSLYQLASTLEPIYFGTYPHSDPRVNLRQSPLHLNEHEQQGTDFYASNEHSPLTNSFGSYYYIKDEGLRKPNFDDTAEEQGENPANHDDIVTLHAFQGRNGAHRVANIHSDIGKEINAGIKDLDLSLLGQVPANRQVELVKEALLMRATQRPTLNLVSGTLIPKQTNQHIYQAAPNSNSIGSKRDMHMNNDNQFVLQKQHQQNLPFSQYNQQVLPSINPQEQLQITHPSSLTEQHNSEEEDIEDPDSIQHQIKRLLTGNQTGKNEASITDRDQGLLRALVDAQRSGQDESELQSLDENKGSSPAKSIPIEKLVDHLMANSRLSTFGIQHENLLLPEDEEVLGEDEEEEEEEEPEENEGTEDAQESSVVEKKTSAPIGSGFNELLNKSNSWIPLDNLDKAINLSKIGPIREVSPDMKDNEEKQVEKKERKKGVELKKKTTEGKTKGKKKKRGKKKKKKKKGKKRKRSKRSGLGLVLGGKVLTRDDLIRLIGILNKMSKKGKTEKEREASKKLLRYMIKLMLTDYKKNSVKETAPAPISESENEDLDKTTEKVIKKSTGRKKVDSIRDILRPLIESPVEDGTKSNEDKKKTEKEEEEDELIELRQIFEEQPEKKKEKKVTIESSQSDNEDKENVDKNEPEEEPKEKKRGLSELSDDLEQYFDSDFYEDMADKMDNQNKTHVGSASGTQIFRVAAKSGRKPRLVYTVPVPIYGQQLFEAADEDDTDFDAVPVPQRVLPNRRVKRRRSARKSPSSRRRRRKQRVVDNDEGKQDQEPEEAEDAEEDEEEPEENEDDKEPPVASSEEKSQEEPPSTANGKQNNKDLREGGQNPSVSNKVTGQETQEISNQDDSRERLSKKVVRNEVKSPKNNKRKRKRRRRKRRKNSGEEDSEVDYDSRYEIPAPIVAGRTAAEMTRLSGNSTNKPNLTKARTTANTIKKPSNKIPNTVANHIMIPNQAHNLPSGKGNYGSNNSTSIPKKSRRSRASSNRPNKATRRRQKPSAGTNSNLVEPKYVESKPEDDEEDDDYYNEGTSYSKICNDDDKCTVSVQSSSPKLEKALKSKNKTNIARHLNSWVAKD